MGKHAACTVIGILILALSLGAQSNTSGQIAGTVTDPSGAVVPGATLVLTSDSGVRRSSTTNASGLYVFPLLEPHPYQMEVSAKGFKPVKFEAISVRITESTQLDVELQIESGGFSITVNDDALLVQSNNAGMGRVMNDRAVSELPLATRNFTQILGLSTGTATYLPDNTSVGRNSQNISVNGARITNNNYMINGVDANSQGTNSAPSLAVPAPESIEEFKVQTSLYDASFGRSGGGSIQAVTKSGTNSMHAEAYEYLRNADVNANNTFLKAAGVARPQLNRNTFGGTVGGPVRKNKTFFFGSYQGVREINGASLINSLSLNVRIAPGLTNDRSAQTLLNTFKPSSATTGTATAINPVALALLNAKLPNGTYAIPTPAANGTYNGSTPSIYNENQFNSNVTHRFSDSNSLTGKLFFSNSPQTLALPSFLGAGPNLPGWGNRQLNNDRVAMAQWTSIVTSNLTHELRVGYNFIRVDAYPQEPLIDSSLGLARGNAGTFPGLPEIAIVGGFTIGTSPSIDVKATAPSETLIDQWAWAHRKHLIRAGAEFRRSENNLVLNFYTRGVLNFLSFNDFLLGNTYTSLLGTGIGNRSLRAPDYNFFVQDDWRISRQFTLNVGLRYELDMPATDTRGRIDTFDPGLYVPRNLVVNGVPAGPPVGGFLEAANAIPAYTTAAIPKGANDSLVKSIDGNNFAPRVGFAFSPLQNEKLAIRGGYGIYYSRTSFQYIGLVATAPPIFVLGVGVGAPLANPFPAVPAVSAFPTVVPGVNLSGSFFDPNLRTPYIQQWNLTTRYLLSASLMWEAGYVGSRGVNLFRQVDINQAPLASSTHPVTNAVTGAVFTTDSPADAQLRAPLQGVSVSGFTQNQSTAQSVYHSLQTSLTKRMSRNLQFLVSYTWSKSIDNASGAGGGAGSGGVTNPGSVGETSGILGNQLDNRANRGVSDFNREHRLVVSGNWQLPETGSPGLAKTVLHGWRVGMVLTAQSGLPIDVIDSGGGTFYDGPSGGLSRASWATGATASAAMSNVPAGYYFNPTAFARTIVAAGQAIPSGSGAIAGATGADFGNVGRNVLRGPAQNDTDLSISRRFRLAEHGTLEFRTEFFNLWNQVDLANPVSDLNAAASTGGALTTAGQVVSGGNFGRIISVSTNPRLVQFGLKLQF